MDTVCRNVGYLRKYHGLTQREMAEILGISVNSLRKLEKGTIPRCFHSGAICRLCDHFQISADFVLREELK